MRSVSAEVGEWLSSVVVSLTYPTTRLRDIPYDLPPYASHIGSGIIVEFVAASQIDQIVSSVSFSPGAASFPAPSPAACTLRVDH